MKNRYRSKAVVFAVASSLTVLASGCSDGAPQDDSGWDWSGPVGSLGLQLQLAPDVVLSAIEYEITGLGLPPKTGSIQVPGTGTTFSATLTEIPVGSGHVIKLRSVAAGDAGLACAGQATFSVTANTTTQVDVVLSCDGLDVGGSVSINGSFNICPSVTATTLSPTVQGIGGTIAVTLSARDVDMAPQPLRYAWNTSSGTLTNATTTAPTLLCTQPGPVALTYTVRDGACVKSGTLNATCGSGDFDGGVPADGGTDGGSDAGGDASTDAGQVPGNPANIVINEVESNGGTPGDWVELYNKGAQAVDVSGWLVRDNDDTHTVAIPASTVLPPGAFLIVDTDPTYGLGGADSARLYTAGAATLIDSYSWTAHAAGSYGRCPNGLGAFVDATSTRGAANVCGSTPDAGTPDAGSELAWPGSNTVTEVDPANTWTSNLSGLAYQAGSPNVLWAVQNGPSTIYKLVASGSQWVSSPGEWSAGKTLVYPGALGAPDSEGIAVGVQGALYVATERDNNLSGVSKLSVLQFVDAPGTTLTAQREWNLTADLPAVGANLGLEAIAFIPDAELTGQGFKEDSGSAYNQARYAQNGGGVFAVGVEGGGGIYLYALDHAGGAFTRLATVPSGFGGVMELAYDPDTHYLWAWADDTYGNKAAVFEIEPSIVSASHGKFVRRKVLTRPTGLPNSNNEGFTFAPDAQCTGGFRAVFWADDSNVNAHSLRQGTLTCGKSY